MTNARPLRIKWGKYPVSDPGAGKWFGRLRGVHVADVEQMGRGRYAVFVQTRLAPHGGELGFIATRHIGTFRLLKPAKSAALEFWDTPAARADLEAQAAFHRKLKRERPDLFTGEELEEKNPAPRENPGPIFEQGQKLAAAFMENPWNVPDLLRVVVGIFEADAGELDSAHQDRNAGRPWRVIAKELDAAADRIQKKIGK